MSAPDAGSAPTVLEVRGYAGLVGPQGSGALRLRSGELAFLEGESGSGKTRFLRHLVDLDAGARGEVILAGLASPDIPAAQLRKEIALLPQDLPNHPGTGRELLDQIRSFHSNHESHLTEGETLCWLDLLEMRPHLDKKIELLSGGERRRLALVASLIPRPRVLLLDEPETGLDPRRRGSLEDYAQRLLSEGMAILWVSHLDAALPFADAPRYGVQRSEG